MRFGSVCSGIEAASVAWGPLGWEAAWLSEIEKFPCEVLKHHYPAVPNLGDMTKLPEMILSGQVEAPDLFCGGTPCQAFSVAGLRQSLSDSRGNLSLIFCEIADAIDHMRSVRGAHPSIVFWENVPGVLNTKDNAFGCFLGALAGEDDALIPPGGRWTNAGFVDGPQRAVAWRVLDAQYFGVAQRRRRVFVVASARADFDPAAVLFEFDGVRRDTAPSRQAGEKVAGTFTARAKSGGWGQDPNLAAGGYMQPVCPTLRAGGNRTGGDRPPGTDVDTADSLIAMCLNAGGMGRLDAESETLLPIAVRDVSQTITSNYGKQVDNSDTALGPNIVFPAMQVRRLTPVECERLQGFPDNYTNIKDKCPDGPRYKALGNSWAVPVVRWIGERIERAVD